MRQRAGIDRKTTYLVIAIILGLALGVMVHLASWVGREEGSRLGRSLISQVQVASPQGAWSNDKGRTAAFWPFDPEHRSLGQRGEEVWLRLTLTEEDRLSMKDPLVVLDHPNFVVLEGFYLDEGGRSLSFLQEGDLALFPRSPVPETQRFGGTLFVFLFEEKGYTGVSGVSKEKDTGQEGMQDGSTGIRKRQSKDPGLFTKSARCQSFFDWGH